MLKHRRQRSEAHRVASLVLSTGALLCSFSAAAADEWTSSALIGNIQSSSSGTPANGSMAHFFKVKGAPTWTVSGSTGCPNPTFVYITSSRFGHRELVATAMLAKTLGKPVAFQGECNGADYLNAHYVVLSD